MDANNSFTTETQMDMGCMNQEYEEELKKRSRPYLVITSYPDDFCQQTIMTLCQGIPISNINKHNKLWFVNLYELAHLEECYSRFEGANICKFHIGRQRPKRPSLSSLPESSASDEVVEDAGINYERREYLVSSTNPQRPVMPLENWAAKGDYSSAGSELLASDPQRLFLKIRHNFGLERTNVLKLPPKVINDDIEYTFYNGRSMPRFKSPMQQPNLKLRLLEAEQLINKLELGNCAACGGLSETKCSQCAVDFCSVSCQRKAHAGLKMACDTRSVAEFAPLPIRKYSEDGFPATKTIVFITAFLSSNLVYIRPKQLEKDLDYLNVLREISRAGPTLKPLQVLPKPGQTVILKLAEEWLRALVVNSANAADIRLSCIDYGNLETAPLANLYKPTAALTSLPRYAKPALLKGMPDVFLPVSGLKLLYLYTNRLKLKLRYKYDDFDPKTGLHSVELFCGLKNINFNMALAKYSLPCGYSGISEEVTLLDLTEQQLPAGDHVELVVMDNTFLQCGYISCATKECAAVIHDFQRYVQAYGECCTNEHYLPRIDSLCVAKYEADGKWYRGCCLEKVGDGYPSIRFIDFGNVVPTYTKNLRPYPKEFTFPQLTLECEIKDFPENVSEELLKEITKLLPIGRLIACPANYTGDTYMIDVSEILGECLNK